MDKARREEQRDSLSLSLSRSIVHRDELKEREIEKILHQGDGKRRGGKRKRENGEEVQRDEEINEKEK